MTERNRESAVTAWLRRAYAGNSVMRKLLAGPVALRRQRIDRREDAAMAVTKRVAKRISSDVLLEMPEFMGRFLCAPQSHVLRRVLLRGSYEPEVEQLFRRHLRPNADVVDIGANIGLFTVLAAHLLHSGRVLAIEPTEAAFARLKANVDRNGANERAILFNGVAAAQEGSAAIHHIRGKEEYSSLKPLAHPSVADDEASVSQVEARTVDSLVGEHSLRPSLVKIDVEGAEMLVLEGALRTIATHRPVVLCEIAADLLGVFGSSQRDVIDYFERQDYRVLDTRDPARAPDSRLHGEILCLPR